MPWHQTAPVNERTRFVLAHEDGLYSMIELCDRFLISRKTGYKWLARYHEFGTEGLLDRSRAPHSCPHRTPPEIETAIVAKFKEYDGKWGPRILRTLLRGECPDINWPPTSTIGDILTRKGLTKHRKRRVRKFHPGAGALVTTAPNEVWSADYKGEVKIDGCYCFPLTILDSHSRDLLKCQGLTSTSRVQAWPVFEDAFRQYGLPDAIRTDNGTPFVSPGRLSLTYLSVWWLKLGIGHQRITPGRPGENARHERMHRTLKEETMMPPAATMEGQQDLFDQFRERYNNVRPHQALDDEVPDSRYQPSQRQMPDRIEEPTYPGYFEVRKVSGGGVIRLKSKKIFLSHALRGEYVGLEEIKIGIWDIMFYEALLARYDEINHKIS